MTGTGCARHRLEGRYVAACRGCRERNRLAQIVQRRRRGVRLRDVYLADARGRTHGQRSTYAHGCRCLECREAERVYKADLRARHKANT